MTPDPGPYSRVYWSVLDDAKFKDIRADMRHFGSWTLMLVVADMAYPAPAFVPPGVTRASVKALSDAGLIDVLPARMFRVKGLKKERERRSDRGRAGAAARWERNADALQPDSERNATGMLDETRRDEQETRREVDEHSAREDEPVSETETDLFAFLAQHGAYIRPESGFGVRLLGLVDRRGVEVVLGAAKALNGGEPLSDRQWVFGLEKALEAIPSPPMDELLPVGDPKARRRDEAVWARRLEWFSQTGQWDAALGPEPEWNPDWGERPNPKVAAA